MEVTSSFWIGFIILVVILLSLDMFVFNKKGTVIDVKKALWLSLFWISLALIFNVGVYFVRQGKCVGIFHGLSYRRIVEYRQFICLYHHFHHVQD